MFVTICMAESIHACMHPHICKHNRRNGDGKRLILRTMAPSGATDKNPAPGQYTPRRDYRGNVGMCTETRSVLSIYHKHYTRYIPPRVPREDCSRTKHIQNIYAEQVKWTKPKLKEKGKDQDSLGPGQYSTVYTQVSAEAPKISFSTTPRSTNLSIGALDTPVSVQNWKKQRCNNSPCSFRA